MVNTDCFCRLNTLTINCEHQRYCHNVITTALFTVKAVHCNGSPSKDMPISRLISVLSADEKVVTKALWYVAAISLQLTYAGGLAMINWLPIVSLGQLALHRRKL